jgi:hypothetical protein
LSDVIDELLLCNTTYVIEHAIKSFLNQKLCMFMKVIQYDMNKL